MIHGVEVQRKTWECPLHHPVRMWTDQPRQECERDIILNKTADEKQKSWLKTSIMRNKTTLAELTVMGKTYLRKVDLVLEKSKKVKSNSASGAVFCNTRYSYSM
jgi:hypothetical protein